MTGLTQAEDSRAAITRSTKSPTTRCELHTIITSNWNCPKVAKAADFYTAENCRPADVRRFPSNGSLSDSLIVSGFKHFRGLASNFSFRLLSLPWLMMSWHWLSPIFCWPLKLPEDNRRTSPEGHGCLNRKMWPIWSYFLGVKERKSDKSRKGILFCWLRNENCRESGDRNVCRKRRLQMLSLEVKNWRRIRKKEIETL